MASCTKEGEGLTPPLLRLTSVRSTVKARATSAQKFSSEAVSAGDPGWLASSREMSTARELNAGSCDTPRTAAAEPRKSRRLGVRGPVPGLDLWVRIVCSGVGRCGGCNDGGTRTPLPAAKYAARVGISRFIVAGARREGQAGRWGLPSGLPVLQFRGPWRVVPSSDATGIPATASPARPPSPHRPPQ